MPGHATGGVNNQDFCSLQISKHHASQLVPKSSSEIYIQETSAGYDTPVACQNDYHPSSKAPKDWRTQNARKGSWAVGHLSHISPLLIWWWPRCHRRISRSSFPIGPSSTWSCTIFLFPWTWTDAPLAAWEGFVWFSFAPWVAQLFDGGNCCRVNWRAALDAA